MHDQPEKTSSSFDIEALLFDIGGVIFPLGGLKEMMSFLPKGETLGSIRGKWISSRTVMSFESGKISESEFASDIVPELGLKLEPEEFLHIFRNWPLEISDNTTNILEKITGTIPSATLSNTNPLHWDRIESRLEGLFDSHFPSHITGLLKPDPEAFLNAARYLGKKPDKIIFFDDTETNVESALKSGFRAFCVKSVADAEAALLRIGVIL